LSHVGLTALALPLEDKTVSDHLMLHILQILQEKAPCQSRLEHYDEEEADDENHDNTMMDSVCDMIGAISKYAGPAIVPYFDTFFDLLLRFCKPARPYTDRSMAIGCMGEVFNEIGEFCGKYLEKVLPVLEQGLREPTEYVRRNSAFCVGVLVNRSGTVLAVHYPTLLGWLQPVCVLKNNLTGADDYGGADADNAISAVASMLRLAEDNLPVFDVLSMMLSCLPLKADFLEAPVIYTCICDILDSKHPACNNLLKEYLILFAKSFMQSKLPDEVKRRIVDSLKLLAAGNGVGGVEAFSAAVNSMGNVELQQVIQHMLSINTGVTVG